MKRYAALLMVMLLCSALGARADIEERIRVSWWLVPMFVVDKDGGAIHDLKKGELTVWINERKLSDFTLYKREYGLEKTSKGPELKPPPLEKRKIIFFVFDTAFGSKRTFEMSKDIVKDVIRSAEPATLFVVMAIDPFDGLVYKAGPHGQKSKMMTAIDTKIRWSANAKSIADVINLANAPQVAGRRGAKYSGRDMSFFMEGLSQSLRNTNQRYLDSFETLYHALNSIKEHKMVYLFTEGISVFARRSIRYVEGEYRYFIKKAADYLSRSGSVLFIVNPAGATESYLSLGSGEDSLRYFAKESGGAYLEGEKGAVVTKLLTMQRAFYEIGFPDRSDLKGPLKVEIGCTRSGVRVHSLNQLERDKAFDTLKPMEREIVAVNLMTANPLFKSRLRVQNARVEKTIQKGGEVVYKVAVPKNWRGQPIEVYRGFLREEDQDVVIRRQSAGTAPRSLKIRFEAQPGHTTAFLVVNGREEQALIKGFYETQEWRAAVDLPRQIKPLSDEYVYSEELPSLLTGAAGYCRQLRNAVFHFVCLEKVVERRDALRANLVTDISQYDTRATSSWETINRINKIQGTAERWVKKYTYDYQIVRDGDKIKEQRVTLSEPKKDENRGRRHTHLQSFISSKVVFAPLTLLEESRQGKYDFKFVKYDKIKGRRCAVVEAMPKNQGDSQFVFGQVWLDAQDHTIRKIRVNPRSIGRYEQLHRLAGWLSAKLFLTMEIEFNQPHRGIYFPTRIILSEMYKGGPVITGVRGGRGWERNRTVFTYEKYRFFEVDSKVLD